VLVADEPVAHQDRARAQVVVALVRELAAAGAACLLATHDEVAVAVADRVVELHDGRLVARA
jgi:ABC-type lipoprotein export system ATPase subunit